MHYASQLGWENSVLCHRYYQGLPNWIQDPISTWEQGKPTSFQDMYALAMTIDHCYWEWDYEHHCIRQAEKEALESHSWKHGKAFTSSSVIASQSKATPSLAALSAKNPSSKLSLSPTPKKQPNTPRVDLSSKLASNRKLTSDEHKKCLENNLCLYCGAGDHKLDSCPKKQTTVSPKVLQQLLILRQLPPRNPWKNRERPPGLCTDWGSHWTPLCSNKSDLTQRIYSFWLSFTFCFPYLFLDSWSGSP